MHNGAHIFPYGIGLKSGGEIVTEPVARVLFSIKTGEYIPLYLLIDSGASISALPKSDAKALGINYQDGKAVKISGINKNPVLGRLHIMQVRISNDPPVKTPFVFLENMYAPRVLGRAGFFETYTVILQESRTRSGMIGTATSEYSKLTSILDTIETK
jgi:hypothetical protein